MNPAPEVILVSRTDRAGDLVLTLPLFTALKHAFPKATIIAHVRNYTASLVRKRDDVHRVIVDDPGGRPRTLIELAREFLRARVTSAVIVHPSYRSILAAWLAGIPVRLGRASNLWQVLLNRRMVQNRSANLKHEWEYNLDLLQGLGIKPEGGKPLIQLSKAMREWGRNFLERNGCRGNPPVVIHPGHGGSAYNVSLSRYAELAHMLESGGIPIALSLGPGEEAFSDAFNPKIPRITGIPDLLRLAAVLAASRAFIGGSTGPMHIAGAVGIPVLVFFPPLFSMTPVRWGSLGESQRLMIPEAATCDGKCDGCTFRPCMDSIALDPILPWLKLTAPQGKYS